MYRCQEPKNTWITFLVLNYATLLNFSLSFQVFSVLCKFSLTPNLLQPPILLFPPHLTNPTNCLPFKRPWSVFQVSQKVSNRTKGKRSGSITLRRGAVQVYLIIWSWLMHEWPPKLLTHCLKSFKISVGFCLFVLGGIFSPLPLFLTLTLLFSTFNLVIVFRYLILNYLN